MKEYCSHIFIPDMTKVLYCGMADDILTPLLLVPDVDIIYVIDLLDEAFAKDHTRQGQMNDIKEILLLGHDEKSRHIKIRRYYNGNVGTNHLPAPCTIMREVDLGNKWELDFVYQGKERNLIRYEQDFLDKWPIDIENIDHLIVNGAWSIPNPKDRTYFRDDMKEAELFMCNIGRLKESCVFYQLAFNCPLNNREKWGTITCRSVDNVSYGPMRDVIEFIEENKSKDFSSYMSYRRKDMVVPNLCV